jgi:predicted nucleic acid-binding protein
MSPGILADTNLWVDFFRNGNPLLERMLEDGEIFCHEIVIGEISMGNLANRHEVMSDFFLLDRVPAASFAEVLSLVESRHLWGHGLQWNDVALLAAALLADVPLWTLDRRLADASMALGIGWVPQS